jgi:hypothetical protein
MVRAGLGQHHRVGVQLADAAEDLVAQRRVFGAADVVRGEGGVHHQRAGEGRDLGPVGLGHVLHHLVHGHELQLEAHLHRGLEQPHLRLDQAPRVGLDGHHVQPPGEAALLGQPAEHRHLLVPRADADVQQCDLLVPADEARQQLGRRMRGATRLAESVSAVAMDLVAAGGWGNRRHRRAGW